MKKSLASFIMAIVICVSFSSAFAGSFQLEGTPLGNQILLAEKIEELGFSKLSFPELGMHISTQIGRPGSYRDEKKMLMRIDTSFLGKCKYWDTSIPELKSREIDDDTFKAIVVIALIKIESSDFTGSNPVVIIPNHGFK